MTELRTLNLENNQISEFTWKHFAMFPVLQGSYTKVVKIIKL